jgi:hypothetical protein
MWFRIAISHESKNSSLTLVNLWARLALANSSANCLHLERQIYLNLYGARLDASATSAWGSDSVVIKFVSLMLTIIADLGKMSTRNHFCLSECYVLKYSYDEVQNRQS